MSLILVGVVHRDPEGYPALLDLLNAIQPDAICLEISPLGLIWRERHAPRLLERLDRILHRFPEEARDHHQIRLIRAALEMPYEYSACRDFARDRGISLHCVDLNWISRKHFPLYETEILTEDNIRALLKEECRLLQMLIKGTYNRAFEALKRVSGTDGEDEDFLGVKREQYLACRVRKVVERGGRAVYVGGWEHLGMNPDGRRLGGLLRDLHPKRALLGVGEIELS